MAAAASLAITVLTNWRKISLVEPDVAATVNCAAGCCTIGQASAEAHLSDLIRSQNPDALVPSKISTVVRKDVLDPVNPHGGYQPRVVRRFSEHLILQHKSLPLAVDLVGLPQNVKDLLRPKDLGGGKLGR